MVSQPNALAEGETQVVEQSIIDVTLDDSRMFKFDPGVTLDELVAAMKWAQRPVI